MPSTKNTPLNELSLPLLSRKESIKADVTDSFGQQINGFAMTCLLSFLLYLQFSISLIDPEIQNVISTKSVNLSVFLFFLTSTIYRQTVQEARIETTIVHLLPELIALDTIALAYCNHAVLGFLVLLVGKVVMAAASVVYCAVQLMPRSADVVASDDEEKDYSSNDKHVNGVATLV